MRQEGKREDQTVNIAMELVEDILTLAINILHVLFVVEQVVTDVLSKKEYYLEMEQI